jgi:hypothetical protein
MILTYIQQGSGNPPNPPADGGDEYVGLDRFGRVVDQRWIKTSTGTALERIQYAFDAASNRQWRQNLVQTTGHYEYYAYDGLYQLKVLQRGTLNGAKTGISGTPGWEEDLTFDPTGNWNNYVTKVSGSTTLNQNRTHNKANEILTIAGSSSLIAQNAAGNITIEGVPGECSYRFIDNPHVFIPSGIERGKIQEVKVSFNLEFVLVRRENEKKGGTAVWNTQWGYAFTNAKHVLLNNS